MHVAARCYPLPTFLSPSFPLNPNSGIDACATQTSLQNNPGVLDLCVPRGHATAGLYIRKRAHHIDPMTRYGQRTREIWFPFMTAHEK